MAEKTYDVFIPINKKIEQIIVLLGEAVNELTDGGYLLQTSTQLCERTTGKFYDNDLYVKDAGIKNGTELILI